MTMKKCYMRIIIILVSICVLLNSSLNRVNAMDSSDVSSKLHSLINEYEGENWSRSFAGGSQCYAFAHFVFDTIFDRGSRQVGNGAVSSNSTCYKLNNVASDITTVGILDPGYSFESLENLLEKVAPGDYIQVKRNNSGGPHSMIAVGVDSSNNVIDIFDANSDGKGTVKHYTQTFSYFMQRNAGVSVYRYSDYTPINSIPTNPQISKSQVWYDLGDTIAVSAYIDNATGYYMSMFKDGEKIVGQGMADGKFSMPASQYGEGHYSFYFTCCNSAGYVDTEWLDFDVVGSAGYSDIWTSKPIYDIDDTVSISVSTICAKGQCVGIDKDGVGRVITELSDSTYTISAKQLGFGHYTAYFTVYNGSGSVDTKCVEFTISERCNLGDEFFAQIKNIGTDKYISNIGGNVKGENIDCDRSRTWLFVRLNDGSYKIINSLDYGAMDVTDYGNSGNGTNIQMNTNWDTTAQRFYIYQAYGAYYIKPVCCEMFLDMDQNAPYNLAAWGGRCELGSTKV